MPTSIEYLKIENFRSIDTLELRNIQPFSVFAGPNGCGKSNFFNALHFIHHALIFNHLEAIRLQGGSENIYCYRRKETERDNVKLEFGSDPVDILVTLHTRFMSYTLKPRTEEFVKFFGNIKLYRINPEQAKEPSTSAHHSSYLDTDGRNLAAVLVRMEKNDELRDRLISWLQLLVPNMQEFKTQTEHLTGSKVIGFLENGLEQAFPPHLISDGTIYLLCLLVAILDRNTDEPGLTLIEEPERGLHPKAIQLLTEFFRENATPQNPIWLTTHSETLVRGLKNGELWLVDKVDGRTQMKKIDFADQLQQSLDQAWLSNTLNGGLPW